MHRGSIYSMNLAYQSDRVARTKNLMKGRSDAMSPKYLGITLKRRKKMKLNIAAVAFIVGALSLFGAGISSATVRAALTGPRSDVTYFHIIRYVTRRLSSEIGSSTSGERIATTPQKSPAASQSELRVHPASLASSTEHISSSVNPWANINTILSHIFLVHSLLS